MPRNGDKAKTITLVFENQLPESDIEPNELLSYCEEQGISTYSYPDSELEYAFT